MEKRYKRHFEESDSINDILESYNFKKVDDVTYEHTIRPYRVIAIHNYGWVVQQYSPNYQRVLNSHTFKISQIGEFNKYLQRMAN